MLEASPIRLETLENATMLDIETKRRNNYTVFLELKQQLAEAKTAIVDFDNQHPPIKSPLIEDI